MRAAVVVAAVLVLAAGLAVRATTPVRFLKLTPRVSAGPLSQVHITVWVDRDDRNRLLELRVVGDAFERASAVSIEGDRSSAVNEFDWKSVFPCGAYQWTATTFDQSGRRLARATDRSAVCGLPDGPGH